MSDKTNPAENFESKRHAASRHASQCIGKLRFRKLPKIELQRYENLQRIAWQALTKSHVKISSENFFRNPKKCKSNPDKVFFSHKFFSQKIARGKILMLDPEIPIISTATDWLQ